MLPELIGRTCQSVERQEYSWSFGFGENYGLSVECPWRILINNRIELADRDHEQQYGLLEPIDVSVDAFTILSGKAVTDVDATEAGDLTLTFDSVRLEIFNNSSGYEAWVLSTPGAIVVGVNS